MSDPQGLSMGEWFATLVASILAGMGGAMAWFNGEKKSLRAKMHTLGSDMAAWSIQQALQSQKLAVMEEKHLNIDGKLCDIKDDCEKLDRKLDDLYRLVQTKT